MKKFFFKMFRGKLLNLIDGKIDWARDFGMTWVDGKPDEDGLMSAIETELTPRERAVCQMAIEALTVRVKQEYRDLLVENGYLKE